MLKHKADPTVPEANCCCIAVMDKDRAVVSVGHFDPGDNSQKRRLAGAGRTEQRHQLAGLHFKAHVLECREIAKLLSYVANLDAHTTSPSTPAPDLRGSGSAIANRSMR